MPETTYYNYVNHAVKIKKNKNCKTMHLTIKSEPSLSKNYFQRKIHTSLKPTNMWSRGNHSVIIPFYESYVYTSQPQFLFQSLTNPDGFSLAPLTSGTSHKDP